MMLFIPKTVTRKRIMKTNNSVVNYGCCRYISQLLMVALLVALSLLGNILTNIEISAKRVLNEDRTKDMVTYAIFYNAFINPKNVSHSLGIISEQLMQWQRSKYSKSIMYYTHLGETTVPFPCPNNEQCKLLVKKTIGWEVETLTKLQEYCLDNPDHNVIYMHSKGTFHPHERNDRMRNLTTLSALSDECFEGLSSGQCNICSSRFSPLPHWHNPGNMWAAKCSYVAKLYPIQSFEQKVAKIFDSFKQNCSECSKWPRWSVGTGRFADEHWVHTHPHVLPCDVCPDTHYMYGNKILPDMASLNFSLAVAPRAFQEVKYDEMKPFSSDPQILMRYRLYELQHLYHETPFSNSFVWSWYQ